MERVIEPRHVLRAADVVVDGLTPHVEEDWSVRAGPLEWDVEATLVHMLGAVAKYTIYLASMSQTFIALAVTRFPGATHADLHASIRPVAEGLAHVCRSARSEMRAFHADGLMAPHGFMGMACVEPLVHADDALQGFGDRLRPPQDLARDVLAAQYPGARPGVDPWRALIAATGRP